jgi:hypothetical protein
MKQIIFIISILVFVSTLSGQVPNKISYQGLLTTSSGTPVQDGSYNLQFDIYNLPSGGLLKHTETFSGVQIQKGTFSVILHPPYTIFSESLFVEITAQSGPGISPPVTFSPRTVLTSSPYALAPWINSGTTIYYNNGRVGIGISTPARKLHISDNDWQMQFRVQRGSETIDLNPNTGFGPSEIRSSKYIGLYDGVGSSLFENGKLGVGMDYPSNPVNRLDVVGNAAIGATYSGVSSAPTNGLIVEGNVGIGTNVPSVKLDVAGQVKITGGSPGTGKVLTSDASGLASWQSPGISGSGTASYIPKYTTSTTLGNSQIYDNGTNVGIGTITPSTKLYVNGDATVTGNMTVATVNTGLGATEVYLMNQNVQTIDNPTFNRIYLNDYGYAVGGFHVGGTSDPGEDNLIVDGNTSLGTTTTTHRLVVANTSADDVLRLIGPDGSSVGYGARLNFGDGDYVYLDEDTDDHLYLYAANGTALMGGYVGVGTTTPAYPLDVAGNCHASSFPTSSDERLKTNVQQLSGVLNKVEKIRGVSFDWNSTYQAMGRATGHREIGVIAQEVETQFPELVSTWGDQNYRAVDYGRLSAVLIEAVKELKRENDGLRQRIEDLERK